MKTIQTIATITPTKELKIQLPEDLPTGTFKVVLVIDETSVLSLEQSETADESRSFLNVAGDLIGCLEGLPPTCPPIRAI
ncbi:hypothetical protein K9N68_18000 [Kovacikia minuta CCNUW1]|uniref:hypothetical protein n=1 Tax=Kovacikia minuta TaxID=2931930 RepID=UPI001CCF63A7|nr:hypothetical protein [Kovacikia minuta]UBF23665.1 hypothetical protein K9N68_18000 [Kovacikia minuta CCNUW1]